MNPVHEQSERSGQYVDTHCHIDLYPTPGEIVDECERAGIYTIAVTNAPSLFANSYALTSSTTFVRAAVGLHPQLVRSHGHELEKMWPLLDQTRYVGEIGLDYAEPNEQDYARQRAIFTAILEHCSDAKDKIVTIHSRRAARDVIDIAGGKFPGTLILHWFSGTFHELERGLAAGFLFSVNSAMLRSKKGVEIIRRIPRDRILTETDGPFVKGSTGVAKPMDMPSIVEALARLWSVEAQTAADVVRLTFQRCVDNSRRTNKRPSDKKDETAIDRS